MFAWTPRGLDAYTRNTPDDYLRRGAPRSCVAPRRARSIGLSRACGAPARRPPIRRCHGHPLDRGAAARIRTPGRFSTYVENASLALALAQERELRQRELDDLHRTAYSDALTGLPNQRALKRELEARAGTPLGVVVLDLDGMRAANAAFRNDYALGGDVLIRAFAAALVDHVRPGEFAARLHTAGDEFCLLLPSADADAAVRRAAQVEEILDGLDVRPTHRHVYGGASVGAATALSGESPAETLARVSVAMHERKAVRHARRRDQRP